MAKSFRSVCLLLAMTVPLALTGCGLFGNNAQPTATSPSSGNTTSPAGSNGNSTGSQNGNGGSTNTGSGNSGQSGSGQGNSNQGSSGSSSQGSSGNTGSGQSNSGNPFTPGSGSTGNNGSSSGGGNGSSSPSPSPSLVVYAPFLTGDNLVKISGRVSNPTNSTTEVAVYAQLYGGPQIASAYAPVSSNGTFQATLNLASAGGGEKLFYFAANYPGASTQGVNRYLNVIPIENRNILQTTELAPAYQAYVSVTPKVKMRVLEPGWLPQELSGGKTDVPYISAKTSAASPYTYTMQFYMTPDAYSVNDSHIAQPPYDGSLYQIATLTGTDYGSSSSALQHVTLPTQPATQGTQVALDNLNGYLFTGSTTEVRWHEGLWSLRVAGPDQNQDIAVAKQVVDDLNTLYLPPTTGTVNIQVSGGSTPQTITDVTYAQNTDVYQIHTVNRVDDALHITASMQD